MMPMRSRLPFFPVPEPGETIYSVVGRCSERLGISNRYLMQLLTEQDYVTSLFSALPGYLDKITGALPAGHPWHDLDALIKKHTALPYFTYFHTKALREESAKLLSTVSITQPISLSLGLSTHRIPAFPKHPRFCVNCLEEQVIQPGVSFFQLAHQLPGITHCWKHETLLANGCTTCGPYPIRGKKLTMPGQCLCESFVPSQLEQREINLEATLWLARESAYLLTSSDEQDGRLERLRKGVMRAGFCRGLLVDYKLLASAIESRFGRDFLNDINYPAFDESGRPSAWIRRCFPAKTSSKRLPSIAGLLVLGAAYDSVRAFEEGCISEHLEKPVETPSTELESTPKSPEAPWKANLKETLIAHRYRISSCAATLQQTSWGIAIEARDQQIRVPLSAQAFKRIGVDRLNNIRAELRQGIEKKQILETHQVSAWTLQLIELDDPTLVQGYPAASAHLRREKHRASASNLMQANPSATRQTILEELPGAYDFLISQDKDWFQKNVPKATIRKPGARPERNDWQKFDTSLANAIQITGHQMLTGDKRPQRITASVLLNKHGALQKFTAQSSRLPVTAKTLENLTETYEQFFERKVRWGVKRLIASEREISMDTLRRETAMSDTRIKQRLTVVHQILAELGATTSEKSVLRG